MQNVGLEHPIVLLGKSSIFLDIAILFRNLDANRALGMVRNFWGFGAVSPTAFCGWLLSRFYPSFSHGKIECEPGGGNFAKKRGNGRSAGPLNPPKSYKKAAKS